MTVHAFIAGMYAVENVCLTQWKHRLVVLDSLETQRAQKQGSGLEENPNKRL